MRNRDARGERIRRTSSARGRIASPTPTPHLPPDRPQRASVPPWRGLGVVAALTLLVLGAVLLGTPFQSATGADTNLAPASCDTAEAVSKARAAFDWHSEHGSDAPMFWRILNTLDADNLPAKPADVTNDTISASDVETFSSGKGWDGWTPIVDALKCVEKAAADSDGGADTDDGSSTESDGNDGSDGSAAVDPAPASCDTADAVSKARAGFDWHSKHGSDAPMFWRILNTLDADNLPAKPSDVTDDTISASDVETFSSGKGWSGWTPINAALQCVEKAAAVDSDDGSDTTDQDSQGTQDTQDSQQSTPESQQQQVLTPQSQQDQTVACTGWDSSDLTIGEDGYVVGGVLKEGVKLGTPPDCEGLPSDVTLTIEVADRIRNNNNYGKPYRDGCIQSDDDTMTDTTADPPDNSLRVLGISLNTESGYLQLTPCDDNTIVERQVVVRNTNSVGGTATKTITITDEDGVKGERIQPSEVIVRRQWRAQNLPAGTTNGYNSGQTYATGDKVYDGSYTWTRTTYQVKGGRQLPAPGSEGNGVGEKGCQRSGGTEEFCWERSFVQYDSKGIDVMVGRAFHQPYRLLIFLSGTAHPLPNVSSFSDDGTALTINVPANDNGFTRAYQWHTQDVICNRDGPGHVQVHVYPDNGPRFDSSVQYRYDGGDKIQICW